MTVHFASSPHLLRMLIYPSVSPEFYLQMSLKGYKTITYRQKSQITELKSLNRWFLKVWPCDVPQQTRWRLKRLRFGLPGWLKCPGGADSGSWTPGIEDSLSESHPDHPELREDLQLTQMLLQETVAPIYFILILLNSWKCFWPSSSQRGHLTNVLTAAPRKPLICDTRPVFVPFIFSKHLFLATFEMWFDKPLCRILREEGTIKHWKKKNDIRKPGKGSRYTCSYQLQT